MKREHIENKYDVHSHFPIINWRECYFCEKDFRREAGYRWSIGRHGWAYSCGTCCASVIHCCDRITHKRETLMAKLKNIMPPPPPLRTYRGR